jgi:hypothetical protein
LNRQKEGRRVFVFCLFAVRGSGIEPRALHMLSLSTTTKLHPSLVGGHFSWEGGWHKQKALKKTKVHLGGCRRAILFIVEGDL